LLEITRQNIYGCSGSQPKIPGSTTLHFRCGAAGIQEKLQKGCREESFELANRFKTEGTEFSKQKYQDAVTKYEDAANYAVNRRY
jgi:hypothetical protein